LVGLYRHFGGDGRLLYVGISLFALRRLAAHEREAGWWADVRTITIQPYGSRALAAAAEIEAIRVERPRWNQQHHPDPTPPPPSAAREREQFLRRLKASRAAAGESDFEKRMTEVLKELGKIPSNQNEEENKK
jgi:hypothetical protein